MTRTRETSRASRRFGGYPKTLLLGPIPAALLALLAFPGSRCIGNGTSREGPSPTVIDSPAPGIGGAAHAVSMDSSARRAGASESWWKAASRGIEEAEYAIHPTTDGLQAANLAQNLRMTFGDGSIQVEPHCPDAPTRWTFSWKTVRIGRDGALHDLASAAPRGDGSRVIYGRPQLDEWYENSRAGIEQGFTIHERPAGKGPLRLVGRLAGSVRPEIATDGGAVILRDAHGAAVLRYGDLHARDAHDREITSRLALHDGDLAIVIDDDGAAYPLTIDPVMREPAWTKSGNALEDLAATVASAGDFNGDGYSDIIVGADGYAIGPNFVGAAFIFYGSPTGPSFNPSWSLYGDQAGERLGISVATAGDVNGDGYSDVIVGATLYDGGQTDEGRVFVEYGSPHPINNSPDWTAECDQAGAQFGVSVASLGDVNNDGYSDVIVGAPLYDNGQTDEGRVFVYYGSPSGLGTSPSWTAEGNQAGAQFGASVATAGDVNADNYSEAIIGAPFYHNGQTEEGRAFLYPGGSGGLSASPAWTAEANVAGAHLGASVATAGDVNGDGYSDVIIGVPLLNNGDGEALVYHGSSGGLAANAAWSVLGDHNSGDNYGISVASAGDVNGDGFADVIVGAPFYGQQNGRVYVYQGSPSGLAASESWSTGGIEARDRMGFSVATAGDVNGDGFSDVIIGSPGSYGTQDRAQAAVYEGTADGPSAAANWARGGGQANAGFGVSVATARDVNGDGFSDVIIGANLYDNGQTDEGRAYVYLGSVSGLSTSPAWTAEGNQAGAQFGYSVACAGDVNGDGYSDVIIGAPYFDHGETDEGRAFVYLGSPSGLSTNPAWTAESDQANAQFGISVASAGDVNGDGYSDVIVGAWDYDGGQSNEGRAYVYHGSNAGLGTSPAWTAESDQAVAQFGVSVATAGDVNGDGYSDIIVGAQRYDNGQADEGRAYAYYGSANGLATSPGWTAESDQVNAQFGISVSTAGDENGDGYSDVIVGAYGYTNSLSGEGRIYVFHGRPGGLLSSPSWTRDGLQAGAALGRAVATAGDANGDGYSDMIAGAWQYDGGQSNEGETFVYQGDPLSIQNNAALWQGESNQASAAYGISVAMAGDVNGDGYADIIVGANQYTASQTHEGAAFVYYGNGGSTRPTLPSQRRTDNVTLIPPLGRSDSESQFRINARVLSVYGRTRLKMESEAKVFGHPFDGIGTVPGSFNDTGNDGQVNYGRLVTGLPSAGRYHWRVRPKYDIVKTPFQSNGPWFTVPTNGSAEEDVVTPGDPNSDIGNESEAGGSERFDLRAAGANPSAAACATRLDLGREARVSAEVVDVDGRRVAVLMSEKVVEAGSQIITWDGRGWNGKESPGGVYFIRVRAGDRSRAWRVVLVR